MKFEVGKKYFNKQYSEHECVFKGNSCAILRHENGHEIHIPYSLPDCGRFEHDYRTDPWVEYKEPVVHTRTMVFWRNQDGEIRGGSSTVAKDTVKEWKKRHPNLTFLKLEYVTYTED